MSGQTMSPLCFVDDRGGSLATLGASIARALGQADAIATTLGDVQPLPEDVKTVLDEVGMHSCDAIRFDDGLTSNHRVVWLGNEPCPVNGAQAWAANLLAHDAPRFDRLVTARLLRDRIERQIKASRT